MVPFAGGIFNSLRMKLRQYRPKAERRQWNDIAVSILKFW